MTLPLNRFAQARIPTEQSLFQDLYTEVIDQYGYDCYFILREIISRDLILNEDIDSEFNDAFIVPAYIEGVDGFEGEGNLLSKFGFELRDEATFIISHEKWHQIYSAQTFSGDHPADRRPYEGDLIYFPISKSFFEISEVEHEQPFYQINNLPAYRLQCHLFEFNAEDFDTGVSEIDAIEESAPYGSGVELIIDVFDNRLGLTPDNVVGERLYQIIEVDHATNTPAVAIGMKVKESTMSTGQQLGLKGIDPQLWISDNVNPDHYKDEIRSNFITSTANDFKTYLIDEDQLQSDVLYIKGSKIIYVSEQQTIFDSYGQNQVFDDEMDGIVELDELYRIE